MALEDFLDRVIAPGPYLAFAMRDHNWQAMGHRFFPRSELTGAVKWALAMSDRKLDVWHAVASFREAKLQGIDRYGERYSGRRTQANAEALKCFWYDADLKQGAWADEAELVRWLAAARDGGLPIPNLWVRSGHGIHLYWVLQNALPVAEWTPAAHAFRSWLTTLGAKGDIGVSADSARLLRPPGTFNRKLWDSPAAVYDMTPPQVTSGDFETAAFLKLLSLEPDKLAPKHTLSGKPAAHVPAGMLAAAKAGLEPGRLSAPRSLASIGTECMQVARSLIEGGADDRYPLWHLMVNLAFICDDRDGADAIGESHPKYSEEDTEAKWELTEREHQGKPFGAPRCDSFNLARPGICEHCTYWQRINSPYSLGAPQQDPSSDGFPPDYRQTEDALEHFAKKAWQKLVSGTVDNVKLLRCGSVYRLLFDYSLKGTLSHVGINESEISIGVDKLRQILVRQGVALNRFNSIPFGDFCMAWIEELRRGLKFEDAPPSFGWAVGVKGEYLGLSVAGTFYQVDGVEGLAMPGDRKIHESYQPKGSLEKWRESAEFVTRDRPDLQVLVAAAFAAPLMEFVSESAVMSIWSMASGARKTSAFRVGTAVWANPITGMSAIRDTPNSVQMSLAETRIMPVYWDEIHAASKEQIATMVEMFFNLTQGRGRARLDPKLEQRDVGFWRTLMVISGNRPISELIDSDRSHTNAGAVRVFEFRVEPPGGPAVLEASTIVAQVERNYGHAGRIYAAWVVQNIPQIKASLAALHRHLETDLGRIDHNERFHVAALLSLVVAAQIATELGLIRMDVGDIYRFLVTQLKNQRVERHDNAPVEDETKYLSQIFERFVADSTDDMLVVQSFAARGRPKVGLTEGRVRIVKSPGAICARARIYLGLDEREMRIDHLHFQKWCRINRLSPKVIMTLMYKEWPIDRTRGVLATSTNWSSGGQVYFYRLQLDNPALEHHLGWGVPVEASNVVRLPPRES